MANKSPRDEEGKKLVYTAKATKNISRVSFVNQTDQVLTTSALATRYAPSVINSLFIDLLITFISNSRLNIFCMLIIPSSVQFLRKYFFYRT